jgi:hypothetical protein
MKAWLRPLVVIGLLGVAAFLLYVGIDAQAEEEVPVRRAGLTRVFPEPGTVALLQDAIGAELAFGYGGRITIDRRVIPDDQMDVIPGINRLSFTPGQGKEIQTLDEGRHCVSLYYWRITEGEDSAGRPYTWCFTSA